MSPKLTLMSFDISTPVAIAQNMFMDEHGRAKYPGIVIMHPDNYHEPFTLMPLQFVLSEAVDLDKYYLAPYEVTDAPNT